MAVFYHDPLALFVTYLRISVQIRRALKKMTFLSYEFGKRQYTFYPVKLSRFPEEKNCQDYPNFIRGNPYKPGQMPLCKTKVSKVKHFFGGFWASKLPESL